MAAPRTAVRIQARNAAAAIDTGGRCAVPALRACSDELDKLEKLEKLEKLIDSMAEVAGNFDIS
jgi:hypothetical protein